MAFQGCGGVNHIVGAPSGQTAGPGQSYSNAAWSGSLASSEFIYFESIYACIDS